MYGQASPRWPASTTLVVMVAFFGVHLNSDLYLASPVTDDSPGYSNNLAEHAKTEHPEHHSTVPSNEASKCMDKDEPHKEVANCTEKAMKEDFAEITVQQCAVEFAMYKCEGFILCKHCNKGGSDLLLQMYGHTLDEMAKGSCKEWESMVPKLPTSCFGDDQRSDDASGDRFYNGLIIGLLIGFLVAMVVFAMIYYILFKKKRANKRKNISGLAFTASNKSYELEDSSSSDSPQPSESSRKIKHVPANPVTNDDAHMKPTSIKSTITGHHSRLTDAFSSGPSSNIQTSINISSSTVEEDIQCGAKLSSKGSKSMKAGKSTKSGIKGGKSTKSAKSAKSGKSLKGGKSTKSKKSTKSSKGGKSAKK